MRLRIQVNLYNENLINKRKEQGITQAELAKMANTTVDNIRAMERLTTPKANIIKYNELMNIVAVLLDCEFSFFFPDDYLDALEKDLLPRHIKDFSWIKEIPLLEVEEVEIPRLEANLTENIEQDELKKTLIELTKNLPEREAWVLDKRFGLSGDPPMTLDEVADEIQKKEGLRVTSARIRQMQSQALRRLRHPTATKSLRPHRTYNAHKRVEYAWVKIVFYFDHDLNKTHHTYRTRLPMHKVNLPTCMKVLKEKVDDAYKEQTEIVRIIYDDENGKTRRIRVRK